jgi:uncharacterized protein (DUF2267 family)
MPPNVRGKSRNGAHGAGRRSDALMAGPGAVDPNQAIGEFFQQVQNGAGSRSPVAAAEIAGAVLSSLLLAVDKPQAREFVSRLPPALRELLRGAVDDRKPLAEVGSRDELMGRLSGALGVDIAASEDLARCVVAAALVWLPRRDVADLKRHLPADLQAFWR